MLSHLLFHSLLLATTGHFVAVASQNQLPFIFSNNNYRPTEIIERDVAIIGGGATGTYAALRLRDLNQSFVVVECQDQLGGHAQIYRDPQTGVTTNIGVEILQSLNVARDFYRRFNVSLVEYADRTTSQGHQNADAQTETQDYDFRSGQNLTSSLIAPDQDAIADALRAMKTQMDRYPYVNAAGFYLEYPVPSDLLMPFGDFVKKYNLGAAVRTIFNYGQGLGDMLDQLTIYVFKNFGPIDVDSVLNPAFLAPEPDSQEVYRRAYASLGAKDVWLNSTVLASARSSVQCNSSHSSLLVTTPLGTKLIRAKKILLTIPPKLGNLDGWDLDTEEKHLFSQFTNSAYYTGVINGTGLGPADTIFENAANDTSYNLPFFPGIYSFNPALGIPGAFNVKYGSPVPLGIETVKSDIMSVVKRLPRNNTSANPELLIFKSHTPYQLVVDADAIAGGYYTRLNALQGRNNVFYTGAAFDTHDSALLWQFTEQKVLPQLLASLRG